MESGRLTLSRYALIDLVLGLERNDGHSLRQYKTFTPAMQSKLARYTVAGGNLMVSGAFVGSDMQMEEEKTFLADVLKVKLDGTCWDSCLPDSAKDKGRINGMGTTFTFFRELNDKHYAAPLTDVLMPAGADAQSQKAFPAMVYSNGTSAAVAYQGDNYRAFTMGFPFECISDSNKSRSIMRAILKFLTNT